MTGLLKGAQAGLAADRLPQARPRPSGPPPRDTRFDHLEARIAELERQLEAERRDAKRAVAEAHAAGRDEAVADDARRTAALEAGVKQAVGAWREGLAQVDLLAASLAASALGKLFNESADLAAMTSRTLARRVERLDRGSVVSVGVSPSDFPDGPAIDALARRAGIAASRIAARPELPAGACRLALRLGEVDLDPLGQWAVLHDALRAMAEGL